MSIFTVKKPGTTTKFSEFVRNASSEEKKRVYKVVMKKSTERQCKVLAAAAAG
ncbi:TPA: hypothetical protein ACID5V_003170 [Pseudomonas aeruginosa]|jgi:hypothetical protein|uniref:hypothetical protein n=1 Tax=Pseudomonas TaxID=286 RepID=UPI0004177A5C|nr:MULTISPECIES: hypothetical protein [Pseudomonas]SCZ18017.1 Uncharacterised protein [Acinetobacter baumannii]ASJ86987.1 hypothetical protein PSA83_04812 [Pseudomonas aeruginosa]AVK23719.1 hypothetical protein CSB85_3672 [Pseudomonas aeruginosa]AWE81696.1 hypothetical protein CSC31_0319 [Pseudomonas aeruginosa]EIU2604730.1 hypothetical protein [Pseudomonas aeruginosa]